MDKIKLESIENTEGMYENPTQVMTRDILKLLAENRRLKQLIDQYRSLEHGDLEIRRMVVNKKNEEIKELSIENVALKTQVVLKDNEISHLEDMVNSLQTEVEQSQWEKEELESTIDYLQEQVVNFQDSF